ncbi:MAG: biotin-dependent carboxyltransferase family protein [Porticoccus sp.]
MSRAVNDAVSNSAFIVEQPGLLTLIQDEGRFGAHRLGLSTGGPADPLAFHWANRLCDNALGVSALEVSVGGLVLEANVATRIAVCGAHMPLTINHRAKSLWRSHQIKPGDRIELGFANEGVRAYVAVAGGFDIPTIFGSASTVVRESMGGLNGGKLQPGDVLPCKENLNGRCFILPRGYRPLYGHHAMLRVIPGYQQHSFSRQQQRRFFSHEYVVSAYSDRMGCRLEGPAISTDIGGILSEGICHGAIQIPPDGQPIVLMNDRQTMGGYPKLGSVLSLDVAQLAQLKPGNKVFFEPITVEEAHNIHHLAASYFKQVKPEPC